MNAQPPLSFNALQTPERLAANVASQVVMGTLLMTLFETAARPGLSYRKGDLADGRLVGQWKYPEARQRFHPGDRLTREDLVALEPYYPGLLEEVEPGRPIGSDSPLVGHWRHPAMHYRFQPGDVADLHDVVLAQQMVSEIRGLRISKNAPGRNNIPDVLRGLLHNTEESPSYDEQLERGWLTAGMLRELRHQLPQLEQVSLGQPLPEAMSGVRKYPEADERYKPGDRIAEPMVGQRKDSLIGKAGSAVDAVIGNRLKKIFPVLEKAPLPYGEDYLYLATRLAMLRMGKYFRDGYMSLKNHGELRLSDQFEGNLGRALVEGGGDHLLSDVGSVYTTVLAQSVFKHYSRRGWDALDPSTSYTTDKHFGVDSDRWKWFADIAARFTHFNYWSQTHLNAYSYIKGGHYKDKGMGEIAQDAGAMVGDAVTKSTYSIPLSTLFIATSRNGQHCAWRDEEYQKEIDALKRYGAFDLAREFEHEGPQVVSAPTLMDHVMITYGNVINGTGELISKATGGLVPEDFAENWMGNAFAYGGYAVMKAENLRDWKQAGARVSAGREEGATWLDSVVRHTPSPNNPALG